MPFKSQAQAGYLHSHPEILGKEGLAEWDKATKGKHLPEHVKKYDDGGVVATLSPGDAGVGAGVRAHQVALEELNSEDNLAPHTAPDKVTSPYADTKAAKVPHQHPVPKGEKPAYKMAQDILKHYDKGGVVKIESVKDNPPIKVVKQKPVEQKVEMGKPASSLPDLPPATKPTPTAPLVYDKGGKVNINDGKHQLGILKVGERVLTEKQNKEYEKEHGMEKCYDAGGKVSSIYDVLKDKGAKGPKKEIKSMTHTKTHNGKWASTHKHHAPFDHPDHDEVHMHGSMKELHDHMDKHNVAPSEGAAAPEAPQLTAPQGPPVAGAPPMGGAPTMPGV